MSRKGTRADALRNAVDQTFQVAAGQAQITRERAQELVDDLAQTAGRLRGALEDIRPPTGEDVRGVRDRLVALERRVAALEKSQKGAPRRAKPPARTARASAAKAARTAAAKRGGSRAAKAARAKPAAKGARAKRGS
jgi:polyhydroxyalkanoate synthesis regulator phasin